MFECVSCMKIIIKLASFDFEMKECTDVKCRSSKQYQVQQTGNRICCSALAMFICAKFSV